MSVATHGLGVVEAVRLAAALDRLPRALVVLGVEAADVGVGPGLSPQVAAAIPALVERRPGRARDPWLMIRERARRRR